MLLSQKEITVLDGEGIEHKIIISKFPATEGLEINILYPTSLAVSAIPKIGDYKISRELMYKIMKYAAVEVNGNQIALSTPQLIDNHLGDWEALVRTILAIMAYNNSFFRNGTASDFFASVVQTYQAKIIETLTRSSEQLSQAEKPPSMN